MLSFILFCAVALPPKDQAGSWILTTKLDGSVGYVWGYKDAKGFVHPLAEKVAAKGKAKVKEEPINYGVAREMFEALPAGGEWYGGNIKTPIHPHESGSTGKPVKRIHLTVIGPKDKRDSALADLKSNPDFKTLASELGDGLAVQSYDPADPMIADIKLTDGGTPDVVIQSENGKVKFRAHDYPGAARVIAEIRKADPRYDPSKDPSGKPALPELPTLLGGLPEIDEQTGIILALGIICVAVVLRR